MINNDTVFITGILGQDGRYLSRILKDQGYNIIGFDRRIEEKNSLDIECLIFETDLSVYSNVNKFLSEYRPYCVYNLAGTTNVFNPWENTLDVIKNTINVPHNFMASITNLGEDIKFCQASSCLVFGKTETKIQNEETRRSPIYTYGNCKNFIDGIVSGFREDLDKKFCSAIFYNHDSPLRGDGFFIKKIIKFAKTLKNSEDKIILGNIDVYKDMGHAKEYMEALSLMSGNERATDYIISSGNLILLRDVVKYVCELSGIDLFKHISSDPYMNKITPANLLGDNSKIFKELGWRPKISYLDVVKEIWEIYEEH